MTQRKQAVRSMIQQLQDAFNETLDVLYDVPEEYLQRPCGHACARGGSARDLLVHNIFHEKQHTGQVWNIRDELRLLQGWGGTSLYPLLVDYYLSRAQLIASLFGLTDEQLDAVPAEGGWSVRQTIEHALGSERRSISALRDEYTKHAGALSGAGVWPSHIVHMTGAVDPEGNETRVIHELVDFSGKDVLEIGCGDGRLIWRYADRTASVIGLDPFERDIELARSAAPDHVRSKVGFRTCEAVTADFASMSFDIVVLGRSI